MPLCHFNCKISCQIFLIINENPRKLNVEKKAENFIISSNKKTSNESTKTFKTHCVKCFQNKISCRIHPFAFTFLPHLINFINSSTSTTIRKHNQFNQWPQISRNIYIYQKRKQKYLHFQDYLRPLCNVRFKPRKFSIKIQGG